MKNLILEHFKYKMPEPKKKAQRILKKAFKIQEEYARRAFECAK